MTAMDILIEKLNEIIALEPTESIEVLGGYVVGELMGDYDNKYTGLYETNQTVEQIGELASDLEISNGTPDQLQDMWNEIKRLVLLLKK